MIGRFHGQACDGFDASVLGCGFICEMGVKPVLWDAVVAALCRSVCHCRHGRGIVILVSD